MAFTIGCLDCGGILFELHREHGAITFVCANRDCNSHYIDDEGFCRP